MDKAEELKQRILKLVFYRQPEDEDIIYLRLSQLCDSMEQYAQHVNRGVAEKQRAACVRYYYDSDNKHGTLATIADTPLVTTKTNSDE